MDDNSSSQNEIIKKIYFFLIAGSMTLLFYGLMNLLVWENDKPGYLLIFTSIAIFLDAIYYRLIKNKNITTLIGVIISIFLFSTILLIGGKNRLALMWITVIPLIAFSTQGLKRGVLASICFEVIIFVVSGLSYFKIVDTPFTSSEYLEASLIFLFISALVFMYEKGATKRREEIKVQLYTHSMTGLPNRLQLLNDLRECDDATLMLLNVDDFKSVNDLYGVPVGDSIILEISERLQSLLTDRGKFVLYKLHADEFALLIKKDCKDFENLRIREFSELLLQEMSRNFTQENITVALTVSIGISRGSHNSLCEADIALMSCKDNKKSYLIFDPSMDNSEVFYKNHRELRRLKSSLSQNLISPVFQPIIDNQNGMVNKYECLVRIIDNGEIVSPSQFLDLSKKAKIYPEITKTMITKSFEFFDNQDADFSINFCIDDILNKKTTEYLYSQLVEFNNANRVIIELLESDRIDNHPDVTQFLSRVKGMGCRIAIDDFGTGYSNFEYILRIDPDYLKIDASLIKNIDHDFNSRIVTETIVNFSKKLNIKTIAEFVHSEEVYNIVRELGIDYSQGYYLGEPKPFLLEKDFLLA